jgi:hypothetical protein
MITFGRLIVFMVVLGISGGVRGEFYKYIDQDGNVQFTDNLSNVPVDQRAKIEQYEDVTTTPAAETGPEAPEAEEAMDQEMASGDDASPEAPMEEAGDRPAVEDQQGEMEQQLREQEKQLRAEYEALMKKREAIEKTSSQRLTPKLRKRLQGDIKDFNDRIKDYEKRREAHNQAVQAYNAQLKSPQAAPAETPPSN